MLERLIERIGKPGRIARRLGRSDILTDDIEEGANPATAVLADLATDQVHRLDAVGAFVNLSDARVADELLHAPFADVAVAAEHLLGVDRDFEPAVGEIAFDHRGEQRDKVVGGEPFLLGLRLAAEIDLQRAPQDQRAGALVEGAAFHQHTADIGVDEQIVGLGLGIAILGLERASLTPILGVGDRVLIGDLTLGNALKPDA